MVLRGSVHLLFDLNDAEYGFFRVAQQFESTALWQVLTDTGTRMQFLHECKTVGNQVHGTLGLAGLELLVAMKLFGADYSTMTLKTLALFNSSLALIFWMVALGRGLRSLWVPVAFAALFTLSGPIFTKLTLLFWGTHELVFMLHGLMICLLAGWISQPTGAPGSLARLFAVGVLAALLTLCNYSLLMPGLFAIGWLSMAGGVHSWRRTRSPAHLLLIPLLGGVALAGFFLTQSVVLSSMVLEGLGYPGQINWQHPFGLSGKGGQSFLFDFGGDWRDPQVWQSEVKPSALTMVPSTPPGAPGVGAEPWVRWSFFAAAGLCSLRGLWEWTRGWMGPSRSVHKPLSGQPLSVFLSVYLMAGFLGITWLSLTKGLTTDSIEGIRPRYYAHLYPVAFAVLACWCCTRPRWIRLIPLGLVLSFGLRDQQQLMGEDSQSIHRYDGVRAWLMSKGDAKPAKNRRGEVSATPLECPDIGELARLLAEEPSAERVAYGAASADFIRGTRILEAYQSHSYWKFRYPSELIQPMHIQPLREFESAHKRCVGPPSEDWWRGVGYAYSILIPESRVHQFQEIQGHFRHGAEAMKTGYSLSRADLER
jgi:hypothetical protein